MCVLSRCVQLFMTLWAVALQTPLPKGFSSQGYHTPLPCPPPGDLPHPGIKPASPAGKFFTAEPLGEPFLKSHATT